jgi:WD40 repeat protein
VAVRAAAWSPDGRLLATGSANGVVRVWSAGHGRLPRTFRGHRASVSSLGFDPTGRGLLSSAQDATARIWTVAGTAPPVVLRYANDWRVDDAAWSPDGRSVASEIFPLRGEPRLDQAVCAALAG